MSDAKMHSDLEGLDLATLDRMRSELMGDRTAFEQLSEEEIERWLAINNRLRLAGRTASKPAANGGRKRTAKTVVAQQSLADLMAQRKLVTAAAPPASVVPVEDEAESEESESE